MNFDSIEALDEDMTIDVYNEIIDQRIGATETCIRYCTEYCIASKNACFGSKGTTVCRKSFDFCTAGSYRYYKWTYCAHCR